MEKELNKLGQEAREAISQLKSLQKEFMGGKLAYDDMKAQGQPLVDTFNKYAKELAKARKMPYKPISLGYFLR